MKVSYAWLQTYFAKGFFKKGLPKPDKLAEILSAHAFEVEGIDKISVGSGKSSDTVFDIKVLPDRAHYALSHKGIAREVSVLTGAPLAGSDISSLGVKYSIDSSIKAPVVRVEDPKLCPRYMLRAIRDVAVGDSPEWLRGRLEAVGARSINNIVDATNFVMLDLGQPLHAFDADKVRGTVSVRLAKAGEKIVILDGREIELLQTDLVIADEEGPIAIAGTKGGKRAEVTTATRNILIESANFNATSVRKTSTRTNLRNDSSKRFENEITPALASEAMDAVTELIARLSTGATNTTTAKIGTITDVYPTPAKPWKVNVSAAFISSVIGQDVSAKEIKSILEKEGCRVEAAPDANSANDELSITPPLDRLDMRIPEDIADEIARIRGYAKLPAKQTPDLGQDNAVSNAVPNAAPKVPTDKIFYWSEIVRNTLVDLGFSEVQTYSLVSKGAFEISYPLASDKSALRERIAPKLADSLIMNGRNADLLGLDAIKIFEIGTVFPKTGEKTSLAIGILPVKKKKGVTAESMLSETLVALGGKLGTEKLGIKIDVKPETGPYGAIAEIDFSALSTGLGQSQSLSSIGFKPLSKDIKYVPFSAYPFIVRDIAVFVPSGTTEQGVVSVIKSSLEKSAGNDGKLLVKGPDLFDRFEKDGRISYAFRMIFQSFERTLSDDEVNGFMSKAYETVKSKGWEVR